MYWKGWKLIESFPGRTDTMRRLSHHRTRRWMEESYPELGGLIIGTLGWRAARATGTDVDGIREAAMKFATSSEPYYELFDVANDPGEMNNLAESDPERVAGLLKVMGRLRGKGLRGRLTVPKNPEVAEPMTDEERAELEKIGY